MYILTIDQLILSHVRTLDAFIIRSAFTHFYAFLWIKLSWRASFSLKLLSKSSQIMCDDAQAKVSERCMPSTTELKLFFLKRGWGGGNNLVSYFIIQYQRWIQRRRNGRAPPCLKILKGLFLKILTAEHA